MNKPFSIEDKTILAAFGASDKAVERLEAIGINSKQAIANIGSGETLSAMSGINSNLATNLYAWASIDFDDDDEEEDTATKPLAIDFSEPIPFTIESYDTYEAWIETAKNNDEIDDEYVETVEKCYIELVELLNQDPDDANLVYDFGRALRILMDPAVDKAYSNETISQEAIMLIKTAEAYFKKAIEMFDGFGRARTMYGSLLCMQKRFDETVVILKPALTLSEGSEDWMIAAHWYLAAKVYLNDTFGEAAEIYQKFEKYAVEGSKHDGFIQKFLINHY